MYKYIKWSLVMVSSLQSCSATYIASSITAASFTVSLHTVNEYNVRLNCNMAISSQQARVVQIRSQVQYFSVHIIYTLPIISTSSIIILGMLQIYVQTRQYRDI